MRSLTRLSVIALGTLAAGNVYAACEEPSLVLIPPAEEIEGNQQQVIADAQAYFQGMQEYVNCLRAELDSVGDDASDLYRNVLVQRNNRAVAEAEAVQRWFESRFPESGAGGTQAPEN